MANPASDMVDFIDAESSLSLTKGTNLFVGKVRPVRDTHTPQNSVFVHGLPGLDPDRTMGESFEIRRPTVQIMVRWNDFQDGDSKARAILNALLGASISGYLDVFPRQSEPTPGPEEEALHFWSIIAEMVYKEDA